MAPSNTDLPKTNKPFPKFLFSGTAFQAEIRELAAEARSISEFYTQLSKEHTAFLQDLLEMEHTQHPFSHLRQVQEEYKPKPPALSVKLDDDKSTEKPFLITTALFRRAEQEYGVCLGFFAQ